MHDVLASIMRDPGEGGHVGGMRDRGGGPAAGVDGCDASTSKVSELVTVRTGYGPFFQSHDCGAFVLENFCVGVDSNEEFFAEAAGLEHSACVAWGMVLAVGW